MSKNEAKKYCKELTEKFPNIEFYAREFKGTNFVSVHYQSGNFTPLYTKKEIKIFIKNQS